MQDQRQVLFFLKIEIAPNKPSVTTEARNRARTLLHIQFLIKCYDSFLPF